MSSDESSGHWLGFDLGGTKMLAAVYDPSFQERGRKRRRTKGTAGEASVTDRIVRTIEDCLVAANLTAGDVRGMGVGIPGPIDPERGVVLEAVNLSWKDVPICDLLQQRFGFPVTLLNDVDAGLYGEYRFGAAANSRTAVGVFPGTGIGGGCVYDGDIIRGKNNTCLEIGHIPVTSDGPLCGCGLWGCLETQASRLAISAEVAKAALRGEAPTILQECGTDLAEIRSGALAKAIQSGDAAVLRIVQRAAQFIGRAVGICVHLISPDTVVLGGGLVEAMPDLFVTAVAESAKRSVMTSFVPTFEVVAAQLGDDAAIRGAAAWAAKSFAGLTLTTSSSV